jgi:uncharacterized protein YggE
MIIKYASLAIAFISSAPLIAQQASSEKSSITATGQATVSAKPDQATIDIGVVTQGPSASAAGTLNAKQTEAVLAAVRKVLKPSDQLKTAAYSLSPNYQNPKPGSAPTISGYTAANVVEVVLDDLTQVGSVIDTALQAGANNIQSLQFGLKNSQAVRAQALREASTQARANAEAIAGGLGVRVVRILTAEERISEPVLYRAGAISRAAATPVEAGTVDVSATITLKVEIAP